MKTMETEKTPKSLRVILHPMYSVVDECSYDSFREKGFGVKAIKLRAHFSVNEPAKSIKIRGKNGTTYHATLSTRAFYREWNFPSQAGHLKPENMQKLLLKE